MRSNVNNTLKTIQRHVDAGDKLLIVMVGAPGSGKSTLVSALKDVGLEFKIASTDAIVDELALKEGITYSQAHSKLDWKYAQSKFRLAIIEAIKADESLIIDRTNMGKKSRRGYFDSVRNKNYVKMALNFQVSDKELQRRLDDRAEKTGKFISPKVLKEMFDRYQAPTKDEGFDVVIDVLTE